MFCPTIIFTYWAKATIIAKILVGISLLAKLALSLKECLQNICEWSPLQCGLAWMQYLFTDTSPATPLSIKRVGGYSSFLTLEHRTGDGHYDGFVEVNEVYKAKPVLQQPTEQFFNDEFSTSAPPPTHTQTHPYIILTNKIFQRCREPAW